MNFFGALKKIATVGEAALHYAKPVVSMLYPPAAPWLTKVDDAVQHLHGSVIATELANPTDGNGALKSESVNTDINSYLETMNTGAAFFNKRIEDDKVLRQAAIDAAVASYNAAAKWKASFKAVDL